MNEQENKQLFQSVADGLGMRVYEYRATYFPGGVAYLTDGTLSCRLIVSKGRLSCTPMLPDRRRGKTATVRSDRSVARIIHDLRNRTSSARGCQPSRMGTDVSRSNTCTMPSCVELCCVRLGKESTVCRLSPPSPYRIGGLLVRMADTEKEIIIWESCLRGSVLYEGREQLGVSGTRIIQIFV